MEQYKMATKKNNWEVETNKKTGMVVEAIASQTFGTTPSGWPQWEYPITVQRTREFNSEIEDWDTFITLEANGHKIRCSTSQWHKIELFIEESEKMMENV
jgi:hypothetical protein